MTTHLPLPKRSQLSSPDVHVASSMDIDSQSCYKIITEYQTFLIPVMKHVAEVETISFGEGRHTVFTRLFRVAGLDSCISAMSLLIITGLL